MQMIKLHDLVRESDLGLTLKKGKTITVIHNKSGKEIIIVDKPVVRKEYEKIGYFVESVNEENESPWTWIYKGLLGGWKKAEKKGGNRVEEVAYAVAFLIKTEYGSGAKKDFLKEFNRKLK